MFVKKKKNWAAALLAICMLLMAVSQPVGAMVISRLEFNQNYTFDKGPYLYYLILKKSGTVKVYFNAQEEESPTWITVKDNKSKKLMKKIYKTVGTYEYEIPLRAGEYTMQFGYDGKEGINPPAKGVMIAYFISSKETYTEKQTATNDTKKTATSIKSVKKQEITGQFACQDKADYYKFTLKKKEKLKIRLNSTMRGLDLQLTKDKPKYSWKKEKIASGTHTYTRTLSAGTYYLKVSPGGKDLTGIYKLNFSY